MCTKCDNIVSEWPPTSFSIRGLRIIYEPFHHFATNLCVGVTTISSSRYHHEFKHVWSSHRITTFLVTLIPLWTAGAAVRNGTIHVILYKIVFNFGVAIGASYEAFKLSLLDVNLGAIGLLMIANPKKFKGDTIRCRISVCYQGYFDDSCQSHHSFGCYLFVKWPNYFLLDSSGGRHSKRLHVPYSLEQPYHAEYCKYWREIHKLRNLAANTDAS